MLILDLTTGQFAEPEDTDQRNSYPDQVLDSEWNPMLTELQSIRPERQEPLMPAAPQIVGAALARYYKN